VNESAAVSAPLAASRPQHAAVDTIMRFFEQCTMAISDAIRHQN